MLKFHQALAARRAAVLNGEKSDEGFTLIELLIVVLIIGVLAAIAIPVYLSTVANSKVKAGEQTVSQTITSITAFASQNSGTLPTNATTSGNFGDTAGDLYKSLPTDPNVHFYYATNTAGTDYCVAATYDKTAGGVWFSIGGKAPTQVAASTGVATDLTAATACNSATYATGAVTH